MMNVWVCGRVLDCRRKKCQIWTKLNVLHRDKGFSMGMFFVTPKFKVRGSKKVLTYFWTQHSPLRRRILHGNVSKCKTLQELRMLSSVTINCQITKIVMNSGSQLSDL